MVGGLGWHRAKFRPVLVPEAPAEEDVNRLVTGAQNYHGAALGMGLSVLPQETGLACLVGASPLIR